MGKFFDVAIARVCKIFELFLVWVFYVLVRAYAKVERAAAPLWHSNAFLPIVAAKNNNNLTCFHGLWPSAEQRDFEQHMRIIPEFITEEEEKQLHEEIEPYMSRMRYEFDHWDDVSIEAKRKIGALRSKGI